MTRLHTALSFHGAGAPPAPRAGRGGAPETEERNEDSSRKPTPAGRAARPTAPPRAGAAGFGRLRAVSACSGVERVVGGCGARPGESRARRLAGARRGRAAGVRCRSRRGEPVRSREAVCRHAGQWSGGDGVPSSHISHRRSPAVAARTVEWCGARRGGRFASRSVFFRPARAHRRSGAQRRTPRSRPIAIAPDAVQCAYKSIHGAPLQYLRRRPRGPLASCRPSCMPSRLSSSMARSDLILLDFG